MFEQQVAPLVDDFVNTQRSGAVVLVGREAARVREVLKDLGLAHIRHNRICTPRVGGGGISGGERRRVAIAVELASTNPQSHSTAVLLTKS